MASKSPDITSALFQKFNPLNRNFNLSKQRDSLNRIIHYGTGDQHKKSIKKSLLKGVGNFIPTIDEISEILK